MLGSRADARRSEHTSGGRFRIFTAQRSSALLGAALSRSLLYWNWASRRPQSLRRAFYLPRNRNMAGAASTGPSGSDSPLSALTFQVFGTVPVGLGPIHNSQLAKRLICTAHAWM